MILRGNPGYAPHELPIRACLPLKYIEWYIREWRARVHSLSLPRKIVFSWTAKVAKWFPVPSRKYPAPARQQHDSGDSGPPHDHL